MGLTLATRSVRPGLDWVRVGLGFGLQFGLGLAGIRVKSVLRRTGVDGSAQIQKNVF